MAVRLLYWHPSDEDQVVGQPQTTFFTDNAEWWAEIFQSGQVAYALWAIPVAYQLVQAENIVDLWQDDPAGNLTATVDEYFWQNPTPPVPGIFGELYLPDPEEIPVASLTATVDEYFWQNPTPPVVGFLYQYLPLGVDEQTPTLFGQYDEDFWQNPVPIPPVVFGELYLPDPEEIPAAALTATVDEYFWINPAVSCYTLNIWPQQAAFETNDVVVVVAFQPDEDFWQNPTPPAAGFLYQYLPLGVDEQTPTLFGQFDEDFWQNPTPPVSGVLYQVLPLGVDEQTPVLFGQYDEDFWQNPVAPVVGSLLWVQQAGYDEQFPALFGQPDEDFWQNPTAPVVGYLLYPQQISFDEQFPVLSIPPIGTLDEDFWLGGMISVPLCYTVNTLPAPWDSDPSELLVVPPLVLLDFPDTLLLDMASDPTYPLYWQINAINTLLSRREWGRVFPAYIPVEQQVLRQNSIQALLDLRSATNPTFAALLAQQEALFTVYGY